MKLIVANLKMYLNTLDDVRNYQNDLFDYKDYFVVSPQSIYLESFINNGFTLSSQDVSIEEDGPFTGGISPRSLHDLNVKYTLIGHSDVRRKYSDEDNYIRRKVENALKNNLIVILCVGELKQEEVFNVLDRQLSGINPNDNLIISYEPIWAIGGVGIPESDKLIEVIKYIKEKGHKKVLYGGSVGEFNIKKLNSIELIDGFLIGSRAAHPYKLKKIIEVVK